MDYAQAYDEQQGRSGPTGVPDPTNPGFDTAGYPLDTSPPPPTVNMPPAAAPGTFVNTAPGAGGSTVSGQTPIGAMPNTANDGQGGWLFNGATNTAGGDTNQPPPDPKSGALAPFSEAGPAIPNIPAYAGSPFKAPTMEDALNDPGGRARWQRGQESLQNWAAARGTLNDTDTAKMLFDYGQNSEAQDYGNVYARQFGTWQANENQAQQQYGINRQTQYIDPWTAAYNEWVQRGNFYLNNQGTVANTALGFARL